MQKTGGLWHRYPVYDARLDDLWPRLLVTVKAKSFQERLRESLSELGQVNPLVVLWATAQEMLDFYGPSRGFLHKTPPVNYPYWAIIVGSQRYWAMRELGYTSCRVIQAETIEEARKLQEPMKEKFLRLYK